MRTSWPVAGLFCVVLLASSACSKGGVASPPDPAPPAAEQLPTEGPAASVKETVPPAEPPITVAPASPLQAATPTTAAAAPAAGLIPVPGPDEVWIWDNEYRPSRLTIPLGTTVVWTSYDTFHQHDVFCPGLFFSSLAYTVSFNYTFNERGSFEYYDTVFNMVGTIVVE